MIKLICKVSTFRFNKNGIRQVIQDAGSSIKIVYEDGYTLSMNLYDEQERQLALGVIDESMSALRTYDITTGVVR